MNFKGETGEMKKRLKKILSKLKNIKSFSLMTWYALFYYHMKIVENWILIDSKNGKDLGSNMLRIAEELTHNPEYKKYKIYISVNKSKKSEIEEMIRLYDLKGVHLIKEAGYHYARVAARAHYLFTDTTFPSWFDKREGQVITNTWHGTPLKMMGKDVTNRSFDMGNVQKAHLISDYLVYPSDFMKDVMGSAYYLDRLYQGTLLCAGYPRNSVFFDKEKGKSLREKLGLQDKKLYGYMPTWRGTLRNINSQKITDLLEYYFMELDAKLGEDEIFLVRLHPFVSNSIDYSKYKHIQKFPYGYEPYDILNICDCLVTDYSSVFFDFANSQKKIILFVYDKELYMDERGVYVSMDTFPFPQVRTVDALLEEMRAPKNYDDTAFLEKFCQYDQADSAANVLKTVIQGEKVCKEEKFASNGKENVLIYVGNMAKNGLTTAFLNLMSNIDLDKRNYFAVFRSEALKQDPLRVGLIPKELGIIPVASLRGKTLGEAWACRKFYGKNISTPSVMKKVDRFNERLYRRNLGAVKCDTVIQYAGYEKNVINMFYHIPARRVIFIHNDMVEEIRTKNNQHEPTLRRAYHDYEKIVPVTQDIYAPSLELGQNPDNIHIVNNCHDYKSVLEKAEKELAFDPDTKCTISEEELKTVLAGNARKFINIGRFSGEKGHMMLMDAFDRYHKQNPDSYLIIIGGYGQLYEKTLAYAEEKDASDRIIIIKSISNPMPILKQCDLFVLSSLYEGLGLVILEADTLGIPVVSTDIQGPKMFMEEHGGTLVAPTVDGIYEGLCAFDAGKVKVMNVDYEQYNQNAVVQYENLFKGEA